MSDATTSPVEEQPQEPSAEPAPGLYVFYDQNKEVQVGVSGDYTIAEAIFVLGAAKAKLELLQYHAYRNEQASTKPAPSKIILPQ